MPKYLIEGSCDGSIFSEAIEAKDEEQADALAVKRLCEAWGETWTKDTTLDDLGDSAMVSPYTPEDYARDEAPAMLAALRTYIELRDNPNAPDMVHWICEVEPMFRAILARIDAEPAE